jgi:hypothetical protein
MSIAYNTSIIRDGLVLYLDAANPKSYPGSGTTWFDLKGINNGTLINGPTFNSDNKGYINFDGVNDKCDTSLLSSSIGNLFTAIVIFTKKGVSALGSTTNRLLTTDRTSGSTKWALGIRNDGNIQFSGSGGTDNQPSFPIPSNQFIFSAITHNINNYSLYINDELKLSNNSSPIGLTDFGTVTIGGRPNTADRYWNGDIAFVMIYNRVLTQQEINQNFNAVRGRYGI